MKPSSSNLLRKEIRELKDHMGRLLAHRAGANPQTLGFLDALEEEHEKELAQLKVKLEMTKPLKSGSGLITPAQIQLAKQKAIKSFLKVGRDHKSVCLFHDDKHASMHIYGTTYHCFACQAHGDCIDIVMKLRNCSFTAAVKFLLTCG